MALMLNMAMIGSPDLCTVFVNLRTRQEAANWNSGSLQSKEREAVVSSPNSMHIGQIIMLTKMMTSTDLRFYEFDAGAAIHRWRSEPSGSS